MKFHALLLIPEKDNFVPPPAAPATAAVVYRPLGSHSLRPCGEKHDRSAGRAMGHAGILACAIDPDGFRPPLARFSDSRFHLCTSINVGLNLRICRVPFSAVFTFGVKALEAPHFAGLDAIPDRVDALTVAKLARPSLERAIHKVADANPFVVVDKLCFHSW